MKDFPTERSTEDCQGSVPKKVFEHKLRQQGIYFLPNFLTMMALLSGFLSVIYSMENEIPFAAALIFVAAVFDALDGRVARLTRSQSKFGAQFDSLADMLSFGVAPAILTYQWQLNVLGKIGWAAAFIFCACTALRLARFNAQIDKVDKNVFIGLPSPAAAAIIASFVFYITEMRDESSVIFTLFILIFVGISMVTSIKYHSFKGFSPNRKITFKKLIILPFVIIVMSFYPVLSVHVTLMVYCLSGYVFAIKRSLIKDH